jgi:hypothetical protein
MFTHLVILKKEPFFLYADNEKEALKVCDKFKDDVAGVVSGKNIIVKHPRLEMTLEQKETLQIEAPKEEPIKDIYDDIGGIEASEEIEKELSDELERLTQPQVD